MTGGGRTLRARGVRQQADGFSTGNGRRPTASLDDDQPRGFPSDRMRALWRDIDRARAQLGLDPAATVASARPWGVAWLVESAAGVAGWAVARLDACGLVDSGRAWLGRHGPLVGSPATWLGRVPLVGSAASWVGRAPLVGSAASWVAKVPILGRLAAPFDPAS